MSPKVSIIIPVYNAEKTLEKCLNSVMGQRYDNYDVILINDGSSDGSDRICKEFQKKHKNIVYIEQDNMGASCARNAGMEKASGKYIVFVDSDDRISADFLKIMTDVARKNNAQLVACEFTNYDPKTGFRDRRCSYDTDIKRSGKSVKRELTHKAFDNRSKQNLTNSVCKLFLRDIIEDNNIRFRSNVRLFEDTLFVSEYYQFIDKFVYIHRSMYNRLLHEGSEINSYKPDVFNEIDNTLKEYFALKKKYNLSGNYESRFALDICKIIINHNLLRSDNKDSISEKNSSFYRFVENSSFRRLYAGMDIKKITGRNNRIVCFTVKNNLLLLLLLFKKIIK